jgi:hypothetical protein
MRKFTVVNRGLLRGTEAYMKTDMQVFALRNTIDNLRFNVMTANCITRQAGLRAGERFIANLD